MLSEHGAAVGRHLEPFPADTSQRLVAQVAQHVQQHLAGTDLDPGGRLPSERTLAVDLGVSRNTVTAAFNELEARGLIRRIRGKGAFKCFPPGAGDSFSWSGKISSKAHLLDEPVLELLARSAATQLPCPLSAGTPSLDCFPTAEYHDAVNRVMSNELRTALAVAPTEGQPRLRASIAKWMGVPANRVMITAGGQEAIDLVARCLIEPGDYAVVESPTYPGAIQCLRAAGGRLAGWETDWSLTKLEQLFLRHNPKLLFTAPTFQNPTGKVMPLSTRMGMLELAARYHVPIIEDDVYAQTYFGETAPPESLYKLDKRSIVIHLTTFSKMFAPGLRVGWVVAPLYMVKQLSLMKMRANLFNGGIAQLALSDFMETGEFNLHLGRLRKHHAELHDTAIAAAATAVKEGLLSFDDPAGGLYLWCKLPPTVDVDLLLEIAEERGLSVAPGFAFYSDQSDRSHIRICYTAASAPRLRKGIEVLTQVLRELTGKTHADQKR